MAPHHLLSALPAGLATLILLATQCNAQTTYISGTFQAAVWAEGAQLQSAAQVQCPSGYPNSCGAIGEPDYCCPYSTTCALASNQVVGCCPQGQSCQGSISGAGSYQPSSWYQSTYVPPPTTYQTYYTPPATTVYNGGGVIVGGAATTQPGYYQGQYCTTLTAEGPNLPTTAGAACGVALIVAPPKVSEGAMGSVGFKRWILVGVLQLVGGLLLGRRR